MASNMGCLEEVSEARGTINSHEECITPIGARAEVSSRRFSHAYLQTLSVGLSSLQRHSATVREVARRRDDFSRDGDHAACLEAPGFPPGGLKSLIPIQSKRQDASLPCVQPKARIPMWTIMWMDANTRRPPAPDAFTEQPVPAEGILLHTPQCKVNQNDSAAAHSQESCAERLNTDMSTKSQSEDTRDSQGGSESFMSLQYSYIQRFGHTPPRLSLILREARSRHAAGPVRRHAANCQDLPGHHDMSSEFHLTHTCP
jgi:hypothetical protein